MQHQLESVGYQKKDMKTKLGGGHVREGMWEDLERRNGGEYDHIS